VFFVEGQRPSRDQLIELAKSDPAAIADLVLALWDRVEKLEAKVAALERNSRTSSKPPSSDSGNFSNPPKPKSLRKKSGRRPGGQRGHPGDTLRRTDTPDDVIEHRLPANARCPQCGAVLGERHEPLDPAGSCECRQVFELPAIRLEITEHRAEKRVCEDCGAVVRAAFPDGVGAPVQYGPRVEATALYLGGYQLVPYQRLAECFAELFDCPLSTGTLANIVKRAGQKAARAVRPIREALVEVKLAHADETGCRLHGERHWLHVFSTGQLTSLHIDAKRGVEGMERAGLLQRFTGGLVHDFLGSYYRFKRASHFLCNAHLLRELTYIDEEMDQPWAGRMIGLLVEAKDLSDRQKALPEGRRRVIGEKTRLRIQQCYCDIVLEGLDRNPEPPPPPGGGRPKRSKPLNLLIRLEQRYEEIMGFFEYDHVPFDNNQAERDLRMMKTREKISGTFRSYDHAAAFCDLRSVISTARKQSRDILETLRQLIDSPNALGHDLAKAAIRPE
jgi:transposase